MLRFSFELIALYILEKFKMFMIIHMEIKFYISQIVYLSVRQYFLTALDESGTGEFVLIRFLSQWR